MSVHPVMTGRGGRRAYEVRWRADGKQRSRQFDRKADADAFNDELRRRRQLGPLQAAQLTATGGTLDAYLDRWQREHAADLEPATRELYDRLYKHRIRPTLGQLQLKDLTVARLNQWQTELREAGHTADAVIKARTVLSSILRHAAENETIPANPLSVVRPPKREHRDEVLPLTPAEVERIRAHLHGRDAAIVSVLAYSGLRPGELRGLRWSDIRQRTILVQRATRPDGTIKATKTGRSRTVNILEPLADDLAAWSLSSPAGSRRPLIATRTGTTWNDEAWKRWRRTIWAEACNAAGLDHQPRPYDLRHSFASLLLAEGRSVHYVAEQLGHAPALTLGVYGHVIDEYAALSPDQRPTAEHEITQAREQFGTGSGLIHDRAAA